MNKCRWFGHKGFKIGQQYVGMLQISTLPVYRNVYWCKRCGIIYYKGREDYNVINDNSFDWQPSLNHLMERNNQTMRSMKLNKIKNAKRTKTSNNN
jgi:hypothetical protein